MNSSPSVRRLAVAGLLATVSMLAGAQTAVLASRAASAPPGGLTLSQAYQAAMEQDAIIRAARAAADSRRERLPQAMSQLLPNVSATAGRNKNHLITQAPNPLTGN